MDKILLSHGAGGSKTEELITSLFLKYFGNEVLNSLDDSAILGDINFPKLAFTTDSHTVNPISFPGGDIGKLALSGTVNDLSVCGAEPLFISVGFIIEEGFSYDSLENIVESMSEVAEEAGVSIVTGDTKVVEKGNLDSIYINTSGIGVIREDLEMDARRIKPGDKLIVNGTLGDHEASIIAARENIEMDTSLESDCSPLNHLIEKAIDEVGGDIKMMRDPTRGGVATTLLEFSHRASNKFILEEENIPIKSQTAALCDIFGYDPIYFANEGKVLFVVQEEAAENVLKVINEMSPQQGAIIGEVKEGEGLYVRTEIGGMRPVIKLEGKQFPRIC